MKLPPTLPLELLDRYFAGECTPDEVVQVEAALARSPEALAFRRVVDGADVDAKAAWERFEHSSHLRGQRGSAAPMRAPARAGRRPSAPTFRFAWRWAAAGLAGVAAVVVVATRIRTPSGTDTSAGAVYATTTGQRATVRLVDGSRVTLAPQSRLTLDAGFGPAHRTVTLVGEAMFEVEHGGSAPFVVNTGDVRTRVLGTSFDVRRYADDREVHVVVRDGRVSVTSTTHRSVSATLSAGELARITDSTAITASGDVAPYTEWTHGRLEFSNAPLPEVLATVGRWYGYRFQLADSTLATERLTATFDYNSRADAVQALRVLLNASIAVETRGADTVVILRREPAGVRNSAPIRSRHLTTYSTPLEVGR